METKIKVQEEKAYLQVPEVSISENNPVVTQTIVEETIEVKQQRLTTPKGQHTAEDFEYQQECYEEAVIPVPQSDGPLRPTGTSPLHTQNSLLVTEELQVQITREHVRTDKKGRRLSVSPRRETKYPTNDQGHVRSGKKGRRMSVSPRRESKQPSGEQGNDAVIETARRFSELFMREDISHILVKYGRRPSRGYEQLVEERESMQRSGVCPDRDHGGKCEHLYNIIILRKKTMMTWTF